MKKIALFVMACLLLSFVLAGCEFGLLRSFDDADKSTFENPIGNSSSEEEVDDTERLTEDYYFGKTNIDVVKNEKNKNEEVFRVTCQAKPNEECYDDYISFYDDDYYYYIFELGTVYNVKMEEGFSQPYVGGVEHVLEFTTSTTSASKLQRYTENILTTTTKTFASFDANVNYTRNWGNAAENPSRVLSIGLSYTQSREKTTTTTEKNTYTEIEEIVNTQSTKQTFSFNKDSKQGYYSYILLGTVKIYEIVKYDVKNDRYSVAETADILGANRVLVYLGDESSYNEDIVRDVFAFDERKITMCSNKPQTKLGDDNYHVTRSNPEFLREALIENSSVGGKKVVLDTDINMSGYNWEAIEEFNGEFDGNGHIIKGFMKTRNATSLGADLNWGLFKKIGSKGSVKNLTFENCEMSTPSGNAGSGFIYAGLVSAVNEGLIQNVKVNNSKISIERDKSCYGFISAFVQNEGKVKNCDVASVFIFGNGDQGGIVGTARWEGYVESCTFGKNETRSTFWYWGTSARSAGGIVGYCFGSYIIDCGVWRVTFSLRGGKGNNPKLGFVVGCIDSCTIKGVGATDDCLRDDVEVGPECYKHAYGMIGSQAGRNVIS